MSLQAIAFALAKDPEFLDRPECPYPAQLKEFLARLVVPPPPGGEGGNMFVGADGERGDDYEILIDEIEKSITSMQQLELTIKDSNERLQIAKVKAALIDKWLSQKERLLNLRSLSQFQKIVVDTMDGILNKDQRTDFMEKIVEYLR
jgi:hypothetical protein